MLYGGRVIDCSDGITNKSIQSLKTLQKLKRNKSRLLIKDKNIDNLNNLRLSKNKSVAKAIERTLKLSKPRHSVPEDSPTKHKFLKIVSCQDLLSSNLSFLINQKPTYKKQIKQQYSDKFYM